MENTEKVLFEDDVPQWFIALGERWVGPLSAADVYERVLAQEISWAHFVWKGGQSDWQRICDVKTFQAAVPRVPTKAVQSEVKEAAKPTVRQARSRVSPPPGPHRFSGASGASGEEKIWFLYYNDSQFGPFSRAEVQRFLESGKIHPRVHVWKDGMENWTRLKKVTEFMAVDSGRAPKSSRSEQRIAPRRPMVAKIMVANAESVLVGMCRDISVGGMQVLTDRIPGSVGSRIKMNVSPSGQGQGKQFEPFVAEGRVVRVLEDGRGFSFRFERLSTAAKRAIERYIDS